MKKAQLVLALCLALAGGVAPAADGHGVPHWSYGGTGGPAHWGSLEKDFEACKLGRQQSPIDISTSSAGKAGLPAIKTSYKGSAGELLHNGHTIQVSLADGGSAVVPSGEYRLLQFHFHTPSEESIDGRRFPLVAHLVHKSDAGQLAVIAILFREGKANEALKDLFAALPTAPGKEPLKADFDPSSLLPPTMGYYAFTGSLTTPPCSEGVAWQVLKTPVEMSRAQIRAFRKVFRMNARPVQPRNGREVQEGGT